MRTRWAQGRLTILTVFQNTNIHFFTQKEQLTFPKKQLISGEPVSEATTQHYSGLEIF